MSGKNGPVKGVSWLFDKAGSQKIFTTEQLSDEQRMFGQTAADFAQKEVFPMSEELEKKKGEVAVPLMEKAGELGLLGVDVPEDYDGLGLDKVTTTVVTEKIADYGNGSFSTVHGAHTGIGTLPIVYFGTEEQKQKYLSGLATGETVGCYCLTEAGSGSDALAAKTKAVLNEEGTHYILNGEKMFITNGAFSGTAIVFAKINGVDFTGFIVEMDWDGVSTGNEEKKMGIHGSSTCTVILEDVKVPIENLLYQPGKGHVIAFNILNIGRYKLGAATLGATKGALRESVVYANQRKQFNTTLGTFRAIREKIADIFINTYVLESMAYRTAGSIDAAIAQIDKSQPDGMEKVVKAIEEYAVEASIMKVWGSEACSHAFDEGVQIHGGYGYINEYPVERGYRDSRINRIFEGTNEINRLLIPGTILKRSMKGQVPLMPEFAKVLSEIKNPEKLPTKGDGPLAEETYAVEMAKKAVIFACGHAIKRYLTKLSNPEYQMILMAMADLIMETFALDSAVSRSLQYIEAKGADKSELVQAITKVFVAERVDMIRTNAMRLCANCLESADVAHAVTTLNTLLPFVPLATYQLKDKIAEHALEREVYNLE